MKYALYLIVFLTVLSSCGHTNSDKDVASLISKTQTDTTISKRQLQRNGFNKREILVVYGTANEDLSNKYDNLLETVSKQPQQGRFQIATKYKSVEEITNEDLTNSVLLLVGTPESNSLIKEFSKKLPLQFTNNSITFNNNTYSDQSDVLALQLYPNPKNNTLPFSFITGNDSNEIYKFVEQRLQQNRNRRSFFRQMDYEVFREGSKITMGNFNTTWNVDNKVFFDYSSGNNIISKSEHFNFISHQDAIPNSEIKTLINNVETSTKKILSFLNTEKTLPKLNYHIYKTAEDKGLMLGNTEQAHFNMDDYSIHTIVNDKYRNNFIQKENDLIIQYLLGESKSLTLQRGLPVYFTTQWQREGYQYWVGRLAKSDNTLSLKELFDNELVQNESGLVVDCMSAVLVDFLIKQFGREVFLKKYNSWIPTSQEIVRLEKKWKDYLNGITSHTPSITKRKSNISYLKGFNFAHEGYGIYNGYASRKATEALDKQKQMGANAITIVPYSYTRGGGDKTPSYLPLNKGAGSENDQGVIHSAYEAKKLGMSVLLKPQVFTGNVWSGDMEFNTEACWC